jgi:pyruvate,orthophosphate dikinase
MRANLIFEKYNKKIDYKIGTMIETVRAALLSSEIAKEADFYSFGTNDLTQFTYGISRDDSEFLKDYYEKGIFNNDPFKSLDIKGVGKLIKQAVKDARKVNKNIEIGICGEQGGDFNTICFCNENDFDYVSCSPYRILGARLSAAISEIKE